MIRPTPGCILNDFSYPQRCPGRYFSTMQKSGDFLGKTFEQRWPTMEPVILKLLQQEPVSQGEWQDLFYDVHSICMWDDKGPIKIFDRLQDDILLFIKHAQSRVLAEREEQALLKAYIVEWRKFFTQSNYLPAPFQHLERAMQGRTSTTSRSSSSNTGTTNNNNHSQYNNNNNNNNNTGSSGSGGAGGTKKGLHEESIVRKLMLDSWNQSIFINIKDRLQESAMKLVHAERMGEVIDSQLVIGVRESYVSLCSNPDYKSEIYKTNFETAYLQVSFCFPFIFIITTAVGNDNLILPFRPPSPFTACRPASSCR